MPITPYHVAVQECNNMPMNSLDLDRLAPFLSLQKINAQFDQAAADVYVMPDYKVTYKMMLYFKKLELNNYTPKKIAEKNEASAKDWAQKTKDAEAAGVIFADEEEKSAWSENTEETMTSAMIKEVGENFKFAVNMTEYYHGQKGNEINLEFRELLKAGKVVFKELTSPYSLYVDVVMSAVKFLEEFPEKFGMIKKEVEDPYQNPGNWGAGGMVYNPYTPHLSPSSGEKKMLSTSLSRNDIFKWSGTPPHIELEGTSQIVKKNNQYMVINDGELRLKPIFEAKLTVNLAIMLIKAVKPLDAAFTLAQGACTFVNSLTDVVNMSVSADNVKSAEQKTREKD
ncbi:MAG: hypothetical protein ACRCXK_07715, partial [Wohlfahrtiimonas sp.]